MKIINIFDPYLRACKFTSIDELEKNFALWTDPKYLFDYFKENESKLSYFKINVTDAVTKTLKEAQLLQQKFYELSLKENINLDELFQNLNDNEYQVSPLSKQKSKQYWLRLYAIKIEPNHYVITGGAIKLTHTMDECKYTKKEKQKLENCRDYLSENGVYDADSLNKLL